MVVVLIVNFTLYLINRIGVLRNLNIKPNQVNLKIDPIIDEGMEDIVIEERMVFVREH